MDVQEAVEAANITSYQMRNSFGDHESQPGRLTLRSDTPPWVRRELREMGYGLDFQDRTSGPDFAQSYTGRRSSPSLGAGLSRAAASS